MIDVIIIGEKKNLKTLKQKKLKKRSQMIDTAIRKCEKKNLEKLQQK